MERYRLASAPLRVHGLPAFLVLLALLALVSPAQAGGGSLTTSAIIYQWPPVTDLTTSPIAFSWPNFPAQLTTTPINYTWQPTGLGLTLSNSQPQAKMSAVGNPPSALPGLSPAPAPAPALPGHRNAGGKVGRAAKEMPGQARPSVAQPLMPMLLAPLPAQHFGHGGPVQLKVQGIDRAEQLDWQLELKPFGAPGFQAVDVRSIRLVGSSAGLAGNMPGLAEGDYRVRVGAKGRNTIWGAWRTFSVGTPRPESKAIGLSPTLPREAAGNKRSPGGQRLLPTETRQER